MGYSLSLSKEEDIFEILSNPVALKLFKLVAFACFNDTTKRITSNFLQARVKATKKQYYSNMHNLVSKTGLISRKHGHYALSNYGKVVFYCINIMSKGRKYFWRLKALEVDELRSGGIPPEQSSEISAKLIEDDDILRIIEDIQVYTDIEREGSPSQASTRSYNAQ